MGSHSFKLCSTDFMPYFCGILYYILNHKYGHFLCLFFAVIALKGVPYKSGPIRFLAKNGSWISCVTEWSSFVNPWSKRLEFIIGKHTVVK